jgi:hypothetical protein
MAVVAMALSVQHDPDRCFALATEIFELLISRVQVVRFFIDFLFRDFGTRGVGYGGHRRTSAERQCSDSHESYDVLLHANLSVWD